MATIKKILCPTKETEELYVFEEDEDIMKSFEYEREEAGKWICFVMLQHLDSVWRKACQLYRSRELTGIYSLKSSTAKNNPRQTETDMGVICFHCGPCEDEALMLEYGHNLATKLNYFSKYGYMPYKSNAQTALGTRATGNKSNSLYRIAVPRRLTHIDGGPSSNREHSSFNGSWRDGGSPATNAANRDWQMAPGKVTDRDWLMEKNNAIYERNASDRALGGYWVMFFRCDRLDQAWKDSCSLYRDGKLKGIRWMKVSTAKMNALVNANKPNRQTGIIMYFCGPADDIELVKSFGENLANRIRYFEASSQMIFKFEGKISCRIDVASQWRRRKLSDSDDDE